MDGWGGAETVEVERGETLEQFVIAVTVVATHSATLS
jgi:hypothetical protein